MAEFSVIIPTYHRKAYLFQAISSVIKFGARFKVEIIVVDDDSTSTLGHDIKQVFGERVKYFRNIKNSGPGFSRRRGLSNATGKFVIFMDDDDYYTSSNVFTESLDAYKQYDDIAFVGFNAYDFNQKTGELDRGHLLNLEGYISSRDYLFNFMTKYNKPKSTFTSVFDKSRLVKAGALDVGMLNDTIIYLRALLAGGAFLSSTFIGHYRLHETNITGRVDEEFIIRNLAEKFLISKEASFGPFKEKIWLARQLWISIFYLINNAGDKQSVSYILKWISSKNRVMALAMRLMLTKQHIKTIIIKRGRK